MSLLRPDDRSSRSRSKSGTRDRSRSRSNVRKSKTPRAPSPPFSAVNSTLRYPYPMSTQAGVSMPEMPGLYEDDVAASPYEVRSPHQGPPSGSSYFPPGSGVPYPTTEPNVPFPADDGFTMGGWTDYPPHERPGYMPPQDHFRQYHKDHVEDSDDDEDLAYGDSPKASKQNSRHPSYSSHYPPEPQYTSKPPEQPTTSNYRYTPQAAAGAPYSANGYQLNQPPHQYQYAQVPEKITYTAKAQTSQQPVDYSRAPQKSQQTVEHSRTPQSASRQDLPRSYSQGSQSSPYTQDPRIVDITPGTGDKDRDRDRRSSKSKSHRLSVDTRSTGLQPLPSPGLGPRMDRLSVSGNRPDAQALGGGNMPPPSPLLEAYHGTYQSLSPMPSALRTLEDDIDDLQPLSPVVSRTPGKHGDSKLEKEKKRVKLYDPEADAKAIAAALNHHKIDTDAICDVLPTLSHDQMLGLRKEYKKQVKIQGKGINLSKHLKMKLTGNFGKVAYVTALGKWESEGYWANFFYQSHSSRRELLIESLMGTTNADIREIKDSFRDKRYSDSLTRCMEKELKMDKFRAAVLMVLEERRQEEQDVYPPEYRDRDVETLYCAVQAKQGGETAMLDVICRRSDAHLREVLRLYERLHGENFARAALKKSNNLVGEVIAHILNGVINKPARDALLLRHAIRDIAAKNRDDELRYELLISRLVRMHWDRQHLSRVKREYKEKYDKYLEEDIEEATKGDFAEFLLELCQTGTK